jgi:hypothetical protein
MKFVTHAYFAQLEHLGEWRAEQVFLQKLNEPEVGVVARVKVDSMRNTTLDAKSLGHRVRRCKRRDEFLGRSTRQGSCIYVALEERGEEVTSDFRAMGADGSEPIEIHADAAPETAMSSLVDLIRAKRPPLVVLDPLIRIVRVKDEKAYAEVYTAMVPLIDVARETGTHILFTNHSGKALKGDPIDSPLGSDAITRSLSVGGTRLEADRLGCEE